MNCRSCGAPMTLFREQGYFFCQYCSSFHFPSASPDGVRLLGEAPEGITCPVCHVPLLLATLDNRYQGYQCEKCRGLLLDRRSFSLTVQSRRARLSGSLVPPRPFNREELGRRRLRCPICERTMETHPYHGPGNSIIDTCGHCNLIWLDHGELEEIAPAPGRDREVLVYQKEEMPDERRKGGMSDKGREKYYRRRKKQSKHGRIKSIISTIIDIILDLWELLEDLLS